MVVYAAEEDCKSKLGKQIQRYRADRPDEWTMDEFIRGAEEQAVTILARDAEIEELKAKYIAEMKYTGGQRSEIERLRGRLNVLQDAADHELLDIPRSGPIHNALWGME